jgi:hypothetical protein
MVWLLFLSQMLFQLDLHGRFSQLLDPRREDAVYTV